MNLHSHKNLKQHTANRMQFVTPNIVISCNLIRGLTVINTFTVPEVCSYDVMNL